MNKTKEEIEKILLSFEREFDRCNGNYKYNRKPVINKFLVLVDTIRNETLEEVEKKIRKAKTNLDEDGDNKYWINEGVLRCQFIINNLKTKNE